MQYANAIRTNMSAINKGMLKSQAKIKYLDDARYDFVPVQKVCLTSINPYGANRTFYVIGFLRVVNAQSDIFLCAEGNPGGQFAMKPFWVDGRGRNDMGSQATWPYDYVMNQMFGSGDDLEFLFFNSVFGSPDISTSMQQFYAWKNRKKWG